MMICQTYSRDRQILYKVCYTFNFIRRLVTGNKQTNKQETKTKLLKQMDYKYNN